MRPLPIDEVLPELMAGLAKGRNAVLVAEPGAGKTTRVPLTLLDQPWLAGRRIIMLEPRRLAARSAAIYMARELGESVGERVGYRVRLDSRIGPRTVVEVVTEGVLTRMLQDDPGLEGVGAILFDEFHERHLHGDLGLALSLQSQALFREDLRLLIMSATLDASPVAELLGGADVIASKGRTFPVQTVYAQVKPTGMYPDQAMAATIGDALRGHDGDVLAFLPGIAEIRRTARTLQSLQLPHEVDIRELHGGMRLESQAEAVAACPEGRRKVVLATSIAESSLTVAGVKVVVDSGLMRVSRFSPRTGMSRLETVPVSKASADQRRGRAGRLAPGVCYRLWTEEEHRHLPEQGKPEILETDLASLALELAVWGIRDPGELDWLTPPPEAAYEQAVTLLQELGAIGEPGVPTAAGRRICSLGLHPRLGSMLLRSMEEGGADLACELAALISDRDLLPSERNPDMGLRLDALRRGGGSDSATQRILQQAEQWKRMLRTALPDGQTSTPSIGKLLAYAFPDRVAQRRSDGRYLLANGRGAVMPTDNPLSQLPYLVVCELDDAGQEARIRLAEGIKLTEIESGLAEFLKREDNVEWDGTAKAVRALSRVKLGAIVLQEKPTADADPERIADALIEAIRQRGLAMLPMSKQASGLLGRIRLMSGSGSPDWPDASEERLLETLSNWLKPHLYGIRKESELQKLNMLAIVESLLSWKQRQELDEQVPTHYIVPSGSKIPIDYSEPTAPVLAVRLQEMFGLRDTPAIARGTLPLTLHLLSPSQRPVQVTRDLASFWESAYFEVKKDLKGRYPKHVWPDNPYEAAATSRAKPRPRG
ncbi:ATP-dependent helicase HrpB [Paenibacillus sp. LHD-117]|uniref:ATP-dependent helicase HrpB n=1 Tax=Paenibacillus sp. LHD-117 TaxID=3071412 RepID=UPI0027E0A09F|nr:ATP-dependent helicase HrpB [Paenibacillus sp. LHD-117]MDQ6421607.1 ATP-dependent helicase HrpB [Paenibacillus sp. LHD-117]